ncbi:MAG: acyltransferase [Oscillospiraceae bacterium]
MKAKRLYFTICTVLMRGGVRRANFARKHHIYAYVGKNVSIQSRVIPLYAELISFHDNVTVARNVDFVAHDMMHCVFNRLPESERNGYLFSERIGCVEVMENVFIGSDSVILYNTRIGPNVVIASGSVVTKDCEPNSVYAGVPARRIGSFQDLIQKRSEQEKQGILAVTNHNQKLSEKEIDDAWACFRKKYAE